MHNIDNLDQQILRVLTKDAHARLMLKWQKISV